MTSILSDFMSSCGADLCDVSYRATGEYATRTGHTRIYTGIYRKKSAFRSVSATLL